MNPSYQSLSHAPQYAVSSAAFPGQGLKDNELAGMGLMAQCQ